MRKRLCVLVASMLLESLSLCAQQASSSPVSSAPATRVRTYTAENPLVYEDMWDLWPYAFLNEKGEPDGFNVDLIRLVMNELKIPYVIKMKNKQEAFEDLRDGKSDLILGLSAGFHDAYGLYSENPVTLFTQSVAFPKDDSVSIHSFRDLGSHKVIVNDSSLCHHLMIDYGWGDNAIPYHDIKQALLEVSTGGTGMIVWNTLSLKWLMNKYHIENLEIAPVNMPHGEYKFMSNDPVLLERLDSIYSALDSSDKLTALRNKWFYPDRKETRISSWIWWVVGAAALLTLILSIYAIVYNVQGKRLARRNARSNKRLALIMELSRVRIWTYEVATRTFTWRNQDGHAAYTYTAEEFAHRYHPEDFQRLKKAFQQLTETSHTEGVEEKGITLTISAKDIEDGDATERTYIISLSVLRRDKHGKATIILGTKKDITVQMQRQQAQEESIQRYWALFNQPTLGIIHFAPDGKMADINERACQMFGCTRQVVLAQRPSFRDFLHLADTEAESFDGYECTKTYPDKKLTLNLSLHPFVAENEDNTSCQGFFAVCRDTTLTQELLAEKSRLTAAAETAAADLKHYFTRIDTLLHDGKLRIASYSPDTHALTILSDTRTVQHALTQTRCMTLVSEAEQKKAMHILSDMDSRADREIRFDISTNLRPQGHYPLHLHFNFIPLHDECGQVSEYFGLCQDVTAQKEAEHKLKQEAQKVQEVENIKTSFVNNMVEEIRTPLNTIVHSSNSLRTQQSSESNARLCADILSNSNHLLHLIDNILYLSRIEAHMVETEQKPIDFVDTFATYCQPGRLPHENVRFITESPYDQLILIIDAPKIGNVIERIIENAVQHTRQGFIRARYDYIGRRLMISVEDTGEGIPQQQLARLNEQTAGSARTSSGLGIPICKEILAQMGGTLDINSEAGFGTTVWITIPCQATIVKRKKQI